MGIYVIVRGSFEILKKILDERKVAGNTRALHSSFAHQLMTYSGKCFDDYAESLKIYYVEAFKLDPEICEEIIRALRGGFAKITVEASIEMNTSEDCKVNSEASWEDRRRIVEELEKELGIRKSDEKFKALHM
jgi:hypothetical protein